MSTVAARRAMFENLEEPQKTAPSARPTHKKNNVSLEGKAAKFGITNKFNFWQRLQEVTGQGSRKELAQDEEKNKKQAWLLEKLEANWAIKKLTKELKRKIASKMFEKRFQDGETIIREGTPGDYFYVLDEGVAEVTKKINGVTRLVAVLDSGCSFGELSLLYATPRSSSVTANGPVTVQVLGAATLKDVFTGSTSVFYADFLKQVKLLENLETWELARLSECLSTKTFNAGETIMRQGDIGELFYLLVDGSAQAVVDGAGVVKEYDNEGYFGELALLNNSPRAATVTAVGQVKALTLHQKDFQNVLGKAYNELRKKAVYGTNDEDNRPRHDEVRQVLKSNWLISKFPEEGQTRLLEEMFTRSFQDGEYITHEGKVGDFFYVIESGTAVVVKKNDKGIEEQINTLGKDASFGELAIFYTSRRTCSVRASGPVTLQCALRDVIIEAAGPRAECFQHVDFLRSVLILADLAVWELARMSEHLLLKTFADKELVFKQGDTGDAFYFIEAGRATAEVDGVGVVCEYARGGYFGELALLEDTASPRAATISANGELKVLQLLKADFSPILGKMYPVFKKQALAVKEQQHARRQDHQAWVAQALCNNCILGTISQEKRLKLAQRMTKETFEGIVVIQEGTDPDYFFLIEEGEAEVTTSSQPHMRRILERGSSFGEIAALFDTKRTCTVKAKGKLVVSMVSTQVVKEVLSDSKIAEYSGFLARVKLLAELPKWDLARLAQALQSESFKDGEKVIEQGQVGEKFYLIREGHAEALANDQVVKKYENEGEYFGELALLDDSPRAATVVARGNLQLLSLSKVAFQNVLGRLYIKLQKDAMLTYSLVVNEDELKKRREVLHDFLSTNWILRKLSESSRNEIIAEMFTQTFEDDKPIITEGTAGELLYVVMAGKVAVGRENSGKFDGFATLEPGTVFGELAILYKIKRTCSVKAIGTVVVEAVSRETVLRIARGCTSESYDFLKGVPILAGLDVWEIASMSEKVTQESFKKNEVVIRQGDLGEKFYLIKSGRAQAVVGDNVVKEYQSLAYFGELALLEDVPTPRIASVVATRALTVLSLSKTDFQTSLGGLYSSFRKNALQTMWLKKMEQRAKLEDEIIQSETLYAAFLNILVEQFMEPCQDLSTLPPNAVEEIFSNVEELMNVHDQISQELQAEGNVGATFLKYADQLKSYGEYMSNHAEALKVVNKLATNSEFQSLMSLKRAQKETTGGLDLKAYLKMPIQRIARIRMLLQELSTLTPEDHPEHPQLLQAVQEIKNLSSYIKKKKQQPKKLTTELKFWQQFRQLTGGVGYEEGVAMFDNADGEFMEEDQKTRKKEHISLALDENWSIRQLVDERKTILVNDFESHSYKAGDIIIEKGLEGDFFYVLMAGEVEVCVPDSGGSLEVKTVLEKGSTFGELALLFSTTRTCTVRAVADVQVEKVHKVKFLRAFENSSVIQNVNFLKTVKLFEPLGIWDVARLSQALTKNIFAAKQAVITQGETGDRFYAIVQGDAQAIVDGKVVGSYASEGYFGELALLDDSPRAASVVATSGLTVVCLSKTEFQNTLGPLYKTLREHAAEKYHIKKDEEAERAHLEWLGGTLEGNWIMKTLSRGTRKRLVSQMYVHSYEDEDVIVHEGKIGDIFYILSEGDVQVFVDGVVVGTLSRGATFGELAVLYRTKRTATIRAKGRVVTYCASEEVIRDAFKDSSINKYADFLRALDLLAELNTYEVARLSEHLRAENFAAGQSIVRKGEAGDRFYLVESGQAQAVIDGKVVKTYGKGGYFGELALLEDDCSARAADVCSLGVTVLSVDKTTFRTVLGKVYASFREQATQAREGALRLENARSAVAMRCLANHWLCHNLSDERRQLLLSSALERSFKEGGVIVEAGAASDHFYLVQEGEVAVWAGVAGEGSPLKALEAGDCFGELDCILGNPTATVTARTAVTCRVVPKAVLNAAVADLKLQERSNILRNVLSFSPLSAWELARLAASATLLHAAAGSRVTEGGACEKLYVCLAGTCAYDTTVNDRESELRFSSSGPEVFGELGLYLDSVEEAPVVAVVESELMVLDKNTVINVLERRYIDIKTRAQETHEQKQARGAVRHMHLAWLVSAFESNWSLQHVDPEKKMALAKEMYPRTYRDGELITEFGKLGDVFFVLQKGEVEVWVPDPEDLHHKVTWGSGMTFGELAVLYRTKRTGTIKAKGEVLLHCAERMALEQAFKGTTITKYANFLESVTVLGPLDVFDRARLSTKLVRDEFVGGHVVYKKGDPGDRFFMVEAGEAKDDIGTKFKPFASFGESALLEEGITPHSTTVTAHAASLLTLSVDKDTFQNTMGKVYDSFVLRAVMEKNERMLSSRARVVAEMVQSETLYVQFLRIMIEEFLYRIKTLAGVTEEHIANIFSNVETIYEYNMIINDQLGSTKDVAKVFNQYADSLTCYSSYVDNYDNALAAIGGLRKNKAFQKFLEEKRKDINATGGLDLMSYLIMPIQRIPRYRMLIAEVLKYTPINYPDRTQLEEALERVKKVAAFVNENKRMVEQSVRLLRVSKEIVGQLPEQLMQPHRVLVADFPKCRNVARKKDYRVICFNDLIVVCGATSNKFKDIFYFKNVTVTPNYNLVTHCNEGIIITYREDESKEPVRFRIEQQLEQCEQVLQVLREFDRASVRRTMSGHL